MMKKKIACMLVAVMTIGTGLPNLIMAENYDFVSEESIIDDGGVASEDVASSESVFTSDLKVNDTESDAASVSGDDEVLVEDVGEVDSLDGLDVGLAGDKADLSDNEKGTDESFASEEEKNGEDLAVESQDAAAVGITLQSSSLNPEKLNSLQEKYQDGKYWNHKESSPVWTGVEDDVNKPSLTDQKCYHNYWNGQTWNYWGEGYYCNRFDGGWQCWGYARKLAYEYYGVRFSSRPRCYDLSKLKAGDIVRFYVGPYYHSIWVTGIEGDSVTYTDCNWYGTCQIRWGTMKISKIAEGFIDVDENDGDDAHIEVAPEEEIDFDYSNADSVKGKTYIYEDVHFDGWAVQGTGASEVYCTINGNGKKYTATHCQSTEAYNKYSFLTTDQVGFQITVPKTDLKFGSNTYRVIGHDKNGSEQVIWEGLFTYKGNIRLTDISVWKKTNNAFKNIQIYQDGTWTEYITKNLGQSWISSDKKIAYVNTFGTIVAVKAGTTTISGEIQNPDGIWIPVSCKVTVKNSSSKPSATTFSKIYNTSEGIRLNWKKVSNVSGYMIYRKSGTKSYKMIKKISDNATVAYTDTAVKNKNGVGYTYKIYTYKENKKSDAGKTKYMVRLTSIGLKSVNSFGEKKISVKWKTNINASGYQIQYSTNSKFTNGNKTVTVSGKNTAKKALTGLSAGKTYYVRVRAYIIKDSIKYYSAFCDKKSAKTTEVKAKIDEAVTNNQYWVIFREGFRNSRIEMSTVSSILSKKNLYIVWNGNMTLNNVNGMSRCSQYYLANDGSWQYMRQYGRLTDWATEVIASNIDIRDSSGKLILKAVDYSDVDIKKLLE